MSASVPPESFETNGWGISFRRPPIWHTEQCGFCLLGILPEDDPRKMKSAEARVETRKCIHAESRSDSRARHNDSGAHQKSPLNEIWDFEKNGSYSVFS